MSVTPEESRKYWNFLIALPWLSFWPIFWPYMIVRKVVNDCASEDWPTPERKQLGSVAACLTADDPWQELFKELLLALGGPYKLHGTMAFSAPRLTLPSRWSYQSTPAVVER